MSAGGQWDTDGPGGIYRIKGRKKGKKVDFWRGVLLTFRTIKKGDTRRMERGPRET